MTRGGAIVAAGVAVAAALVGCLEGIDKPTPPDMTALVARYADPRGTFDASVAGAAVAQGREVVRIAIAIGIARRLRETLNATFDELDAQEQGVTDSSEFGETQQIAALLRGEGTLRIHRICDGHGDALAPNEIRDGTLDLIVNLTHRGLDPVIWGWVASCRYRELGVRVELQEGTGLELGDLRAFVGDNYTIDNFGADSPMLLELDMRGRLGGASLGVRFDIKALPAPRGFEVRVGVDDGDVVLRFTASEELVRVRAGNGDFKCDDRERRCRASNGSVVPF